MLLPVLLFSVLLSFLKVEMTASQNTAAVSGKFAVLVTGANKGIGLEIVRKLARYVKETKKGEGLVFLASRDPERGKAAVVELKGTDAAFESIVSYVPLDVTCDKSIKAACESVLAKAKEAGCEDGTGNVLDVLVNNAGISFKMADTSPPQVQFPATFKTNYYGVRKITDAFLPLMKNNGRVVSLASRCGGWAFEGMSPERREELKSLNTVADVDAYAKTLLKLIEHPSTDAAQIKALGFHNSGYGNSKLLVSRYMYALAQEQKHGDKAEGKHLYFNSCCPGWCKTDMTNQTQPPKSAEEGADTPVLLATMDLEKMPQGEFWTEGKAADYYL